MTLPDKLECGLLLTNELKREIERRYDGYLALEQQLAKREKQNVLLRDFAKKIAEQTPEKPDYWSSCSQCEYNSGDAEEALAATQDFDNCILCDAEPEWWESASRFYSTDEDHPPYATPLYKARK